jgi:hypothetical protein
MFAGHGLSYATHVHYTALKLKCQFFCAVRIVYVYCAWMDVLVCSLRGVSPMHTASRQHHQVQELFGMLQSVVQKVFFITSLLLHCFPRYSVCVIEKCFVVHIKILFNTLFKIST